VNAPDPERSAFRHRLHTVIFEADSPGGKAFDVALLVAILVSIVAVCLESVASIRTQYGTGLRALEWVLTLGFTAEYMLRLYSVDRPLRYARSFYGVVDLLSILPTYLSLAFAGTHSLLVIRALRLLRVFRVFKLGHFVSEAEVLRRALAASRRKIMVFVGAVLTLILILGTLMYLVEGGEGGQGGFTSIPESVYWAVVTMTTVGYGDIAPVTVLCKFLASIAMIIGYGVIAVPTGILGVEMHRASKGRISTQACPSCSLEGHDADAKHCKHCGAALGMV
jgi:voltage-gated potassium channel